MGYEFRIEIASFDNTPKASLVNYISLNYVNSIKRVGWGELILPGRDRVIDLLEDKDRVRIYWRNKQRGITSWVLDFNGFYREAEQETDDYDRFTAYLQGRKALLAWRRFGFKAGVSNRTKFIDVPGETVLKTMVDYNAGQNATTGNSRIVDGVTPILDIATDQGRGNTISWYCAYRPLMEELQEASFAAGGDFDLIPDGSGGFLFEFYPGQLGEDKSDYIEFSLERGNMLNPRLRPRRIGEKTVAIVAGWGEAENRVIGTPIPTGVNYVAADGDNGGNHIEDFLDRRDAKTMNELIAAGEASLEETQAEQEFTFGIRQIGRRYGDPTDGYVLGDLVWVKYKAINEPQKIVSVAVSSKRGNRGGAEFSVEAAKVAL